jgi:hypothetical protein
MKRRAAPAPPAQWAWWAASIPEWPQRLILRNIARDEVVTINLETGSKRRRRRKEQPIATQWWQE